MKGGDLLAGQPAYFPAVSWIRKQPGEIMFQHILFRRAGIDPQASVLGELRGLGSGGNQDRLADAHQSNRDS